MSSARSGAKFSTRDAILDGGERALGRHGYRKLTMQDIADESSIAKRTLYLYFENKAQVCLAALDRMLSASLAEMDACIATDEPGLEQLRRLLTVRLISRIDRCVAYHHTLDETCRVVYPGKVEDFHSMAMPDVERVEHAISRGLSDGSIRPVDARETALLLVRGTNGFLPSALSTQDMRDLEELHRRIVAFIDLLVRGLAA